MTHDEFIDLVKQLRTAMKRYFAHEAKADRDCCIIFGMQVDQAIGLMETTPAKQVEAEEAEELPMPTDYSREISR